MTQPPTDQTTFQPYVSDEAGKHMPEFTFPAVIVGALLGIIFGASSLYLLLKVGMTVSASVPIAVLSITLFRAFSSAFGFRRVTILENNIVQTTGSAGESIAFGVGVTMPALLLLGFEMDVTRVMTVSILGGLLGILMMIPLRRAFIVKQHGKLQYPEGTACAEVLMAGEKGGTTAKMVFLGFGIAFIHKFLSAGMRLWNTEPSQLLYKVAPDGTKAGFKGAAVSGELSPELLGVGFLIGPRIAGLMMAGAVMSYFVLGPMIASFGDKLNEPVFNAPKLVKEMDPDDLRASFLRYIGAGAVAAGGIISMFRAMPLIIGSIRSGMRDLRGGRGEAKAATVRTEQDLPMSVVLYGSLGLVLVMMFVPQLGLGFSFQGLLGAVMILLFGFLFVTVSSRLTGEVGSSSNPISGMTIATLLMVCLIFLILGQIGPGAMLTALTVAAVVCIASSNGGTTSQDLKTGFLVGATPKKQQWAIAIGAFTSATVIGLTMLALNAAGTHYTNQNLPQVKLPVPADAPREKAGRPHEDDANEYRVVHVRQGEIKGVSPGRYLVDASGTPKYKTDIPIRRENKKMDDGSEAPEAFSAPQPQLFSSIIEGILGGTLEWGLVIIGVLIAIVLELAGVPALPFAVGMYLSLATTTPIFIGGLLRWLTDRIRGKSTSSTDTETTPGVLLSSGYIAGGTLCGLIVTFFAFSKPILEAVAVGVPFYESADAIQKEHLTNVSNLISLGTFLTLAVVLLWLGSRRGEDTAGAGPTP